MNYELKNMITQMYGLCDTLDEGPLGMTQINTEQTMRECLRTELTTFLMYLSASDGSVAWQESEFIRDYLGWNLSTNEIHQFIKENQIYSTEFESEVPASMRLFVRADNAVYENEGRNESLACEILFRIYEALGKEFLACDNDVTDNEVEDLTIYLRTLQNYIQDEVKSKQNNSDLSREEKVTTEKVTDSLNNIETDQEESLE